MCYTRNCFPKSLQHLFRNCSLKIKCYADDDLLLSGSNSSCMNDLISAFDNIESQFLF